MQTTHMSQNGNLLQIKYHRFGYSHYQDKAIVQIVLSL